VIVPPAPASAAMHARSSATLDAAHEASGPASRLGSAACCSPASERASHEQSMMNINHDRSTSFIRQPSGRAEQ
jgi:hypothetical protein